MRISLVRLLPTHGAKRIFGSLAEYEAAHNAAWATLADGSQIRWNNIGGVAKFWWDKSADTLLMPDLTGLLREMAGYDSLGVGGTHIDTIREITGLLSGCGAWGNSKAVGPISESNVGDFPPFFRREKVSLAPDSFFCHCRYDKRADKLFGRFRHYSLDLTARLYKAVYDIRSLVCGYSSAYREEYFFI